MEERIVVFDPGQTTGYALFLLSREEGVYKLIKAGDFPTWEEIAECVGPELSVRVICERVVQLHASFNPIGIHVTGAIEYYCWLNGLPLVFQQPSMMTSAEKWGLIDFRRMKLGSEHAKDAVLHGLAFFRKQKLKLWIDDKIL